MCVFVLVLSTSPAHLVPNYEAVPNLIFTSSFLLPSSNIQVFSLTPTLVTNSDIKIPLIIQPKQHKSGNQSTGLPAECLVDFKCQFNPTDHGPVEFITGSLTGSEVHV